MFVVLLALAFLPNASSNDHNALHFGSSSNDYVEFKFDMTPFRDSFSLCSWIKRVDSSTIGPVVFNYYTSDNEIVIALNNEKYNSVHSGHLYALQSNTPQGSWFNYCITWSLATRTSKLYLNGTLIETVQTPAGRALQMGGTLFFNRFANYITSTSPSDVSTSATATSTSTSTSTESPTPTSTTSSHIFGGQISQFNIYSDVLSSEAVQKIAEGGLCFDQGELSEIRILRWEEILDRARNGNVIEVSVCSPEELLIIQLEKITGQFNKTKIQLSRIERTLETVTGKLNSTEEKLEVVSADLNKTETALETVTGKLNSTKDELVVVKGELQTEVAQHNMTEERLDTCSSTLANTQCSMENARTFENITIWDVLYTPPYLNKVLTDEMFQQLTSSWIPLSELV